MTTKPAARVLLVRLDSPRTSFKDHAREFESLAISAGYLPVLWLRTVRASIDPKFFVGRGTAAELKILVEETCVEAVLVANTLTPVHARNLAQECKIPVLDRTELILEIFAKRALSYEGKLQVELAQLKHLSTRLVRGWTHLERQKGGIGLRGPGETQLETDRRLLGQRVKTIQKRLDKVISGRAQNRSARAAAPEKVVALMGYTNAGKSTLFNLLTGARVAGEDRLFMTLDPTMRKLNFADGTRVVVGDTVGFIEDLPKELVVAFKATLEELRHADLLLHVVDWASDNKDRDVTAVNGIITEMGLGEVPALLVYNKLDKVNKDEFVRLDDSGAPVAVGVSAHTGAGVKDLQDVVAELVYGQLSEREIDIEVDDGSRRSWLYNHSQVLLEESDELGSTIKVKIRDYYWRQFIKIFL